MSIIGQVVPEIWAKKWSKSGQRGFFEKISRNMTDTEKMMMTNIRGNFVADNIVYGMEVLAHHPEKLPLEIWECTDFHQVSSGFQAYLKYMWVGS